MYGPPPPGPDQVPRVPKPKGITDLPRYLKELLGGFFYRFGYILKIVWDTGHWILFLMAFIALFSGVTPIIGSLLSKEILNELQRILRTDGLDPAAFWKARIFYLIVFLFVYRVLKQIVTTVNGALNRIAGEKVVKQVKLRIMEKSREVDHASYDRPEFYEKLENANREAGNRPLSILSSTFSIVSTVIELISYIAVMATAPGLWWSVFLIIAVSVPSAIVNFVYRRKNFNYVRRRSKDRRQMNYYSDVLVNRNNIKEVRLYDLADTFIDRYLSVFSNYYRGLRRLIRDENLWHIGIILVSAASNFILYVLIALRVVTGQILIGDYSLYTGAVGSISACVSTLISTSAAIYEGTLFIDNLIAFMKEQGTIRPLSLPGKPVARGGAHTVEFRHVSFRYPGTDRDVLKDVCLTFRPGETVSLVGLNGAGKTTLIKLLTRLYDPTDGVILLDGVDLREYDVREVYDMFGIIFQDFGKYAFTVEENIRFGAIHKPEDRDAVIRAAVQSNVDGYIRRLPDGYDTPLTRQFEPNGTELSGGQWQKIAIARAFYADSDILILDEPTASLDPMAEQEIFRQFDELRRDKISVFVSHRLSSATTSTLIVVLENGQVIEQGTHRELMDRGGRYRELFTVQAARYAEELRHPVPENPPRERPPRRFGGRFDSERKEEE